MSEEKLKTKMIRKATGIDYEIPEPICEICGFEQTDEEIVVYTHYGVFCLPCMAKYEPRLKKICEKVCKAEIEIIKKEVSEENNFKKLIEKDIYIPERLEPYQTLSSKAIAIGQLFGFWMQFEKPPEESRYVKAKLRMEITTDKNHLKVVGIK